MCCVFFVVYWCWGVVVFFVIFCCYYVDNVMKCGGGVVYSLFVVLWFFFGSDFNGDNGQLINYYVIQDGNLLKDLLLIFLLLEIKCLIQIRIVLFLCW